MHWLILINKPIYFQDSSNVFNTDSIRIQNSKFKIQKLRSQVITYRSYKDFDNDNFQVDIKTYSLEK